MKPYMICDPPWYNSGLRFQCQKCGRCCGGAPGAVFITENEIELMAKKLKIAIYEFKAMFTQKFNSSTTSLREKKNYDCIFYNDENGCLVYDARPMQCRLWPFWERVISSRDNWEETAKSCKGIGLGKLYKLKEIKALSERPKRWPV